MVFLRKFSAIRNAILKVDSYQNYASYQILKDCKLQHTGQSNRQCEHFSVTLISIIEAKINWQEQLSKLVHAYNCSHSNATWLSPFYLMFGRHPMLPIDVKFGVRTPDIIASTSHGYIQKLQRRLDWAYKTAYKVSKREAEHSKKQYDQKVKCTKLEPGDLVLVRQKTFKWKHKISDRRENTPYCVIQCIDGHLPVYAVQLVDETTRFWVLHRNSLFPLAMRNGSAEKQQNMEEEPKWTDPEEEMMLLLLNK